MTKYSLTISLLLSAFMLTAQVPMSGVGRPVLLPTDVDSLFYWFDAMDATTITTTNNKVTQWDDKSGNGYNVLQADTSKAPTYSATSGPGGSTAALTFDGSNDFLASAAHFWGSDDIEIFLVLKSANATLNAYECVLAKATGTTNYQFQYYFNADLTGTIDDYRLSFAVHQTGSNSANYKILAGRDLVNPTIVKSTSWRILSSISQGNGIFYNYTSGAADAIDVVTNGTGDGTIYNSSTPKLGIGARDVDTTPGIFFKGSISEIIVFSRAITNAERQGIEAYLSSKYNLRLQNRQSPRVISN